MKIKGKNKVDALKNLKDQNINGDFEDKLLHSKEREIFRNIYDKRLDKIEKLTKKIDGNDLIFSILSTAETVDFNKKNDPLTFL